MRATLTQAATRQAPRTPVPTRPMWAYLAFLLTVGFIPIHAYWALGGTWGLPPSAVPHGSMNPATESVVRAANWGVCGLLLIGAAVLLTPALPLGRRIHPLPLLVPLGIGSVVCVSHGLYGIVTKGLYVMGAHGAVDFPEVAGVSAATAAAENRAAAILDLLAFEPYFLIEGVLIALAGWQFARTPAARRRWAMTVVAGTLLIEVFGTLLSLSGLRFAVS